MLRRYVRVVVAWPKAVIALALGVTLALALFIPRITLKLDVDDQIPPGHPLVVTSKRIEQLFGGKFTTIIGVYPASGTVYTEATLGKIQRITEGLEKLPGVRPGSVLSLMSKSVKDIHSTGDAIEVNPLAKKVPTGPEELAAFKERVDRNKIITSLLVNEAGTAAAVLVDFSDFQKAGGPPNLFPAIEKLIEPERDASLEIVAAGAPSILYWLMQYTRRAALLFGVVLAMIGYLHYRAFRTLQGMFVPLVTALVGVVWALGLMGAFGKSMDPWNIMTPILLLAIGAGHSVQILKRYYEEYDRVKHGRPELSAIEHNQEAVVEATTQVGKVMLAAGTIAALSFASLYFFELESIRNFGICTAFGIFAALAVEMSLIPAMRVLLSPPSAKQSAKEKEEEVFDPLLEKLSNIVRTGRERPILWVFLGLILIAGVGALRLKAGNSMSAQFFESNAPVRGFRLADEKLTGTRVIQVLIDGGKPESIQNPKVLAGMDELSQFIQKQPLPVGKVVSFVDVMRHMKRVLEDDPKAEGLPDTPEMVAQYLLLYSMSSDEEDFRRMVNREYSHAVLTVYLKTDNYQQIKALLDSVREESKRLFAGLPVEVMVGGGMTNAIALDETMVKGKINNLLFIAGLVLVFSSVLFRSVFAGILVLLPLATSALVNLGLMGWTGIYLSMGTAAISAMAVGVGADYAVYFLFRVREETQRLGDLRLGTAAALTTSGKAIAYVATAVAGGYICLAFSLFKVHVLLGLLVALTMVTSSVATVAFLPSVLLRLNPSFLTRGRKEQPPAPTVGNTADAT
jgi:uncharacterized protein